MAIDKDTVKHVAHLARINLQTQELEKLSRQLHDIVGFIDTLKQVDVAGVEPTSHIVPVNNVLRDDTARESLPHEKTLKNAPAKDGTFFVVPTVIE